MTVSFQGRILVPARAEGPVLALEGPLSLWGGLDPQSGEIIDRRHPQSGEILSDQSSRSPGKYSELNS